MLQSDDGSNILAAAAQQATAQNAEKVSQPIDNVLTQADSINHAVRDSLSNISSFSDVKDIVTGQNPIIIDAISSLIELTLKFVPKLIGAILILWIGFKLIRVLKRSITKLLEKRGAEASLKGFLTSLVDVLMKVMLVIMAMDVIGIKATSFIAIIGAAGLAIGMALQGTLQNFASGVIILLLKPFRVGDYIESGQYKGYVKDIRIFNTIIRPFNGRIIIVPNSQLATSTIINHTDEPKIRLEVVASVAYGTDLTRAKEVLMNVIKADELILQDPAPSVCVSNLGDSSVDFSMWMWVTVEDYWTVWKRIRENIYNALYDADIEIPFPQVQVHGVNNAE
ncbi:MAG: mechanosensitive ion channel [Bacteroidales bacterium]|nr:mechanosensitive ion channel [Bacteroidales bacterium]